MSALSRFYTVMSVVMLVASLVVMGRGGQPVFTMMSAWGFLILAHLAALRGPR